MLRFDSHFSGDRRALTLSPLRGARIHHICAHLASLRAAHAPLPLGRLLPLESFFRRVGCNEFRDGSPRAGKSHVRQAAVEQGTTFKPHVTKADFAAGWAVEM
jgi:hypothetical protein